MCRRRHCVHAVRRGDVLLQHLQRRNVFRVQQLRGWNIRIGCLYGDLEYGLHTLWARILQQQSEPAELLCLY